MFLTMQGGFYVDNKHVVIPVITDEKNKNPRKTIYKNIDEKYFKKGKKALMSSFRYMKLIPMNHITFKMSSIIILEQLLLKHFCYPKFC